MERRISLLVRQRAMIVFDVDNGLFTGIAIYSMDDLAGRRATCAVRWCVLYMACVGACGLSL